MRTIATLTVMVEILVFTIDRTRFLHVSNVTADDILYSVQF